MSDRQLGGQSPFVLSGMGDSGSGEAAGFSGRVLGAWRERGGAQGRESEARLRGALAKLEGYSAEARAALVRAPGLA
jgi:hypothetical protein